jgi:hypothetical protein
VTLNLNAKPERKRLKKPRTEREANENLLIAARWVREELDIWEPTERSRAALNNAILDVEALKGVQ